MKRNFFPFLLLAFFVFLGRSSSFAVPFEQSGLQPLAPNGVFSTFGASTLEAGKASAAVGFEMAKEPDFYRYSGHFAYAPTDSFEISASAPYVSDWEGKRSGFEDIVFGARHRFFSEGKYGPAVAYLIEVSPKSGRKEFSTDGHFGAGIIVSKRVGPVAGHLNFIYSIPGDRALENQIVFSGGLDFSAGHKFKILGEVYAKKSYYESKFDKVEARVGYRFLTTENLFTTFGVGFDLKDSTPEYRLFLSFTGVFPENKRVIKKITEEE